MSPGGLVVMNRKRHIIIARARRLCLARAPPPKRFSTTIAIVVTARHVGPIASKPPTAI